MRRFTLLLAVVVVAFPHASRAACGGCKAEQVTAATANSRLFGGSDAAGGVGDWYLTNGTVVAIIDNIDTTPINVLPSGTASVDITSSNAVETGGTLVDVGLKGKQNDQFPQGFNTGGLSLANVFVFHKGDETAWGVPSGNNPCATIGASNPACPLDVIGDPTQTDCAAITVYGIMLGTCKTPTDFCSTRSAPTMRVRTTYKACKGHQALELHTEVWNQSGNAQTLPIFDVFLWGGRGLVPFAADAGRGFNAPQLDLSSTAAVIASLTSAPYFAAPGNVSTKDGNMARGKKAGAVSYGYFSEGGKDDSNGPAAGGTLTQVAFDSATESLQSPLLTAATLPVLIGPMLANNASRIVDRRIIVGKTNDVASVVGDGKNPDGILARIATLRGIGLGTVSGSFSPGPSQEGTVEFIRVGGTGFAPPLDKLNSAPISQVRCKGSFKNVQLPTGDYKLHAVFPGRDDIVSSMFTINAAANTVVPPIALPKTGKLKIEIHDAALGTGMPAKVSLSPSPSMRRDLASFTFDSRTGKCSNNLSGPACTTDAACGAGNTCFRTCTNVQPQQCNPGCPAGFICASDNVCRQHGCNTDSDCTPGNSCHADTTDNKPESYPGAEGGAGQSQVIYTDKKGKATVEVKPGSYTVTISRGPEYTIKKMTPDPVVISAGVTTDLGVQTVKRVVDTTGYLSADFHIHSGRSLDSSAPLEARVRSFAGEGLEVMISTDHDINTDYQPIIKKVGMTPFITSIIGTEVTTSVPRTPYLANGWGHINSWPSIYDANLRRSGSVEDESVSASTIYDRLRAQSNQQCVGGKKNGQACTGAPSCPGGTCTDVGEQVVQLNHPRAGLGGVVNIGMFDNIGYNPAGDITNCQKYPVVCASSACNGGTNDGTSCTSDATCTGGGKCSCGGGSIPGAVNGCNDILLDRNVIPQSTLCTSPSCGGGFEGTNGTRNIDFDIMEIDNSGIVGSFGDLKLVRRDWLSILNQGIEVGKVGAQHQLWGTGVSDSHRLILEIPGYSRTYIGAGEFPATTPLDVKAFDDEVLGGNISVTSGPYITFTANAGGPDVGMGETLAPSVTSVNLKIKVQAAPWVPVDEVRIIQNGCVVACYNSTTSPAVSVNPADPYDQTNANVVRFDTTSSPLNFAVSGDSYFIVEASPNLPLAGNPTVNATVNSVAQGVFPYGFTNPIFADGNGDSDYTGIALSPGTGEPTCPALPVSCSAGAGIAAGPASVMVAQGPKGTPPAPGLFARIFHRLVGTAIADSDTPNPVVDDSDRARQREEALRKPNPEHVPWHLIEFPTPVPTPAPQP